MLKFAFNLIDDGLVGQQLFAGEATRLAYMTDEALEGRDAFLQKRDPDFSPFPALLLATYIHRDRHQGGKSAKNDPHVDLDEWARHFLLAAKTRVVSASRLAVPDRILGKHLMPASCAIRGSFFDFIDDPWKHVGHEPEPPASSATGCWSSRTASSRTSAPSPTSPGATRACR